MLSGWCATSAAINLLEVIMLNFLEIVIFNLLKVVIYLVRNEFLTRLLSRVTRGIGFELAGAGTGGQYPSGTYPLPFLPAAATTVLAGTWKC